MRRRTLLETVAAVKAGQVTPPELVDQALARISELDPAVNAFTVVRDSEARSEAELLAATDRARPLFGVPIVVKDLYDVAGTRTTGCCAAYLDVAPATSDAAAVARLRAAGAVVIAKTNQHELACGATSELSAFGPVRNPWDVGRIAGGSSGGSAAAVAAGVVTLGLGSDTGGSIRVPAAMCGVTGLKPTHGAISLRGAMPMIPAFDSGGPIAVDAADCGVVYGVLAGYDDEDVCSREGVQLQARGTLAGLRIGLLPGFLRRLHPDVKVALVAAAAQLVALGAELVEVQGPDPDEAARVWRTRWAEVANVFRDLWDDPRVSPPMQRLLEVGRAATGVDVAAAQQVIRGVRRQFDRALRQADILLAPTVPFPAPPADAAEVEVEGGPLDVSAGGTVRLTSPVNQAGLPALALPVGLSAEGLPVGAQLIGPEWSERLLCSVAAVYQEATEWHLRVAGGDSTPPMPSATPGP